MSNQTKKFNAITLILSVLIYTFQSTFAMLDMHNNTEQIVQFDTDLKELLKESEKIQPKPVPIDETKTKIIIEQLSGDTTDITNITKNSTIADLKQQIFEQKNIAIQRQHLYLPDKPELEDAQLAFSYISPGTTTTITLIERMLEIP